MSRFLFVVPPLTGHVNPTISVARALERRGHEVAWVAHPGAVRPLLPDGATLHPLDDRVPASLRDAMIAKARATRGLAGLKFLWEDFLLPLARAMTPGVEEAVDALQPDALIVDQQALAGGLVARRRCLPWATSVTTSAGVTDPLAGLPKVEAWLDDEVGALQEEVGLAPIKEPNLSPSLVVVFSTEALVGPLARFPEHYAFVGPSFAERGDTTPFPFDALDDAVPRVLVSLGTVNAQRGARFYRALVDGLRDRDVQMIFAAPPELVGELPEDWIAQRWVPQLQLLPRVDAVVGHGGHNTTCEALAHGLPLVLAPIRDDQPVVAGQVVDAGAGLRVRFGRVGPAKLREAVERVLTEPSFRDAAKRVQDSFARAGGAEAAAKLLEETL